MVEIPLFILCLTEIAVYKGKTLIFFTSLFLFFFNSLVLHYLLVRTIGLLKVFTILRGVLCPIVVFKYFGSHF